MSDDARDAARYRWLREHGDDAIYVLRSWKQGDAAPPIKLAQGDELDQVIDVHLHNAGVMYVDKSSAAQGSPSKEEQS